MKFIFEKSAVFEEQYPLKKYPEVAIAGRSNSGKSSLINSWAQSKIAKVSGVPGKTRLLNFFIVEKKFRLVDTPGYGFAARSSKEKNSWQIMIENYLVSRKSLRGLILVMDIRRDWDEEEQMLTDWCNSQGIQVFVVLNKADKVNQKEKHAAVKAIEAEGLKPFIVSAKTKKGVESLIQSVWSEWVLKDPRPMTMEDADREFAIEAGDISEDEDFDDQGYDDSEDFESDEDYSDEYDDTDGDI